VSEIDFFFATAQPFMQRYSRLDVRGFAVRAKDRWILLGYRVRATNSQSIPTSPESRSHSTFHATSLPISELQRILSELGRGKVNLGGIEAEIVQGSAPQSLPFQSYFNSRGRNALTSPVWPARTLWVESYARGEVPEGGRAIEDQIRLQDTPWDGIEDVQRNFIETDHYNDALAGRCQVILPYPARLAAGTTVGKASVDVEVEFLPNNRTEGFSLICIGKTHDDSPYRRTQYLQDVPLEGGRRTYSFATDKTLRMVKVILHVDGTSVDSWTHESFSTFGAPARLAAFNENLSAKTIENLLQRKQNSDAFEQTVSLAFHLAGFAPGWYGSGNESDIVAFPDAGRYCLVIECTLGRTDVLSKIKKLSLRTQGLRSVVDGKVYGVLVCQRRADIDTQSIQDQAGADGQALISPTECLEMIRHARDGASTRDILHYLADHVPKTGSMMNQWNIWS
jgi:hypothetical protein